MNAHDTLNLKRLSHLIINDLRLQAKTILIAAAAIIIFIMLMPFRVTDDSSAYFNILYVGGFIFTSVAFSDLHNRSKAHLFLMLPCSNLERFLSKWFLTSVGFAMGALIIYYILSVIGVAFYLVMFKWHVNALNIFDPDLWNGIVQYIILQSIILLGAIIFKKQVLIKTALVISCFFLVLGLFSLLIASIVFYPDYSQSEFSIQATLRGGHFIFWVMLAPLCWYITYLRITLYELI